MNNKKGHVPPPWGTEPPQSFHGATENERELLRLLNERVPDESKARDEYWHLADLADLIGRPDIAYELRKIGDTEQDHYVKLQKLVTKLPK